MLESAVLTIGIVYLAIIADLMYALLNPRIRYSMQ